MVNVLVGIPSGDSVSIAFMRTHVAALNLKKGRVYRYSVTGMNAVSARNEIVAKALEENHSHVFFMDSDMTFPKDCLQTLLGRDKDVVGGFYLRKKGQFLPNAFELGERKGNLLKTEFVEELKEVEAIGTGCLLVKTQVFRDIKKPWFEYECHDQDRGHMSTEDIVFCDKARDAGYKIWCDGTIKCGHVGSFVVMPVSGKRVDIQPV
jgi:GT2 family glycosyltransferase